MSRWSLSLSFGLAILLALSLWLVGSSPKVSVASTGRLSLPIVLQSSAPGDEVLVARTQTSKTTWLGGNKYSLDSYITPIHYDAEGWQDINTALVPGTAPWDWTMTESSYRASFLEDFTAGQIALFEKSGESVALQPMALEWTNDLNQIQQISMPQDSNAVVADNLITWADAYGLGIDFSWETTNTRLVKTITVNSFSNLPTPEQYIFDGGNPVLRFNLIFDPSNGVDTYINGTRWPNGRPTTQTFDIVEFRSGADVLWGFMPLRYWSSNIAGEDRDEGFSVATLGRRGNSLYISIRVPYDWIQSAAFPIYIDTDLDDQTASSGDDGYVNNDSGVNEFDNSGSAMVLGFDDSWWDQVDAWATFDASALTQSITIDTAYIEYRSGWNYTGSDVIDFVAEDVADSSAPSDHSDYHGMSWTTASVEWDIPEWTTDNWFGNTLELKTIVQELVDDYDVTGLTIVAQWSSGGADRKAYTYDNDPSSSPKLHIEYTAAAPDISNTPSSKAFGTVAVSSSYWSSGSAPSWPLDDAECFFAVTNNSGAAVDITVVATNFTGGVGWTLAGSTGEDTVVLKAGKSGDANEGAMVTLTTSAQSFITSLADAASKEWELKLETGTFTDGVLKESTVTLTASLS